MTTPEEERDIPRFCPYCGSDPADCEMVSVCCGASEHRWTTGWSSIGGLCGECNRPTDFVCGSKES